MAWKSESREKPAEGGVNYEMTDLIRRNRTVDWDKKESARAVWGFVKKNV